MSASTGTTAQGAAHALPLPDSLRLILESGVQAPSAENRHYFRFEQGPVSVRLVSTDLATWAEQPHRRALALISYGAVVENMALRAAELGQAQSQHWSPEPQRPELIAELSWRPGGNPPEALASAIARRHSNRRFYRREPLPPSMLQRVAAAADAVAGAGVSWLDQPAERRLALQTLRIAETERFRRRALHHELFSAVRFDAGWKQPTDQGLPPGALEVELPMRAPFSAFRHWPLMRAACALGMHRTLGLRAADLPCRLAPHIGLLTVDSTHETLGWLQAGQALQRVWLAATLEGLGFQAMAAPVALALQNAGGAWVSQTVQDELRARLPRLTGGVGTARMFFRIGRAAAPSVVAGRPPLSEFIV
ncbi:MAG TPA: hypothetical protein VGE16_04485 [Albitalea sp.]